MNKTIQAQCFFTKCVRLSIAHDDDKQTVRHHALKSKSCQFQLWMSKAGNFSCLHHPQARQPTKHCKTNDICSAQLHVLSECMTKSGNHHVLLLNLQTMVARFRVKNDVCNSFTPGGQKRVKQKTEETTKRKASFSLSPLLEGGGN